MVLKVSLLRETRHGERRVLLLPEDAVRLRDVCDLWVEAGAGRGLGIPDEAYIAAGAQIVDPDAAWSADFLLRLKAPTPAEVRRIRHGAAIAALFHAEGTPDVVAELLGRRISAFSFEYMQDDSGAYPLMAATGEIAGQMAVIYAAYHLQSHLGGSGVSLMACTRVPGARVAILGYGNVGRAAARAACALGARVTVWTSQRVADGTGRCEFRGLNEPSMAEALAEADVVIGALRVSTFDTPPVVTKTIVTKMGPGSVIVDVTAGFGAGYIETSSKVTTLDTPFHVAGGVKHIKIRTLPLGVHRTAAGQISATYAPYIVRLITQRVPVPERDGLIVADGKILNAQVRRHYESGFHE
jgi:alanine dehydrogenase